MPLQEELVDSFRINNNVNLYLLNAIAEKNLTDIAASKGRNVGEQFAHIHNVRLMWLAASAPDLMADQQKIEKGNITKQLLIDSLKSSSEAMQKMLLKGFTDGKIKGAKPHPASFLAYLLAHEAHHRGQIVLSLKQGGHPLDKKILFGIWEWGSRGNDAF